MVARDSRIPGEIITHRFALDDIMEAYDVFSHPADTDASKVVLTRSYRRLPAGAAWTTGPGDRHRTLATLGCRRGMP